VYGYNTSLPTASVAVTPLVGVVNGPLINRQDFFANRSGVGSTPAVRWSPPSVGTATYYSVGILELDNSRGDTTLKLIAQLYTQGTSLLVPEGLLNAGQAYVFKIRSVYAPGINFAKAPFKIGPTSAGAVVMSGVMQP